jgi:enoyl-CoA hydratase/carnithine racemase
MSTRVCLEKINNIAFVALSRPEKYNALDMDMFYQIDKTIKKIKKDKSIRVVILTGQGENFCSGLDIKSVLQSPFNSLKLLWKLSPWRSNLAQRVSTAWRDLNVPVISVIQGKCWGGGLQIALGADFKFAYPNASFSIMEAKWGLVPDMGGTLPFKEHLALDQAKLLAMTAEEISAEKALSLGLITAVSENALDEAKLLANRLMVQSPDAIAGVKKLFNGSWSQSAGYALARETWYQIKVMLGKNQRIKTYNQTHDDDSQRPFVNRKNW